MTLWSEVNMPRNQRIAPMQARDRMRPWMADRRRPWVAAVPARSLLPAPRWKAIWALMPTPKPMATALIRFCRG